MAKRIRVDKGDPPVSTTVLAASIVQISRALDELRLSGLNEDAIIVLLHDKTRLAKRDIRTVLDGLRQLEGWYCRDSGV